MTREVGFSGMIEEISGGAEEMITKLLQMNPDSLLAKNIKQQVSLARERTTSQSSLHLSGNTHNMREKNDLVATEENFEDENRKETPSTSFEGGANGPFMPKILEEPEPEPEKSSPRDIQKGKNEEERNADVDDEREDNTTAEASEPAEEDVVPESQKQNNQFDKLLQEMKKQIVNSCECFESIEIKERNEKGSFKSFGDEIKRLLIREEIRSAYQRHKSSHPRNAYGSAEAGKITGENWRMIHRFFTDSTALDEAGESLLTNIIRRLSFAVALPIRLEQESSISEYRLDRNIYSDSIEKMGELVEEGPPDVGAASGSETGKPDTKEKDNAKRESVTLGMIAEMIVMLNTSMDDLEKILDMAEFVMRHRVDDKDPIGEDPFRDPDFEDVLDRIGKMSERRLYEEFVAKLRGFDVMVKSLTMEKREMNQTMLKMSAMMTRT